ncbi:hypothetical protein LCGC14_2020270 [marine sediment metagenome]|uniref:Uncharacterized protein n=1 Tax=marine sediment metagenome TaxID=412755 RepID=A0A0F9FK96_9ZZZZ
MVAPANPIGLMDLYRQMREDAGGELSYEDSPRWQLSTTQDIYTATFGAYWNFGTTKRNANGVISGITDTTNYSPVF